MEIGFFTTDLSIEFGGLPGDILQTVHYCLDSEPCRGRAQSHRLIRRREDV